jgi:hypothetical protein
MVALSLRQWERSLPFRGFPFASPPEQARFHAIFTAKRHRLHNMILYLHSMVHFSYVIFLAGLVLYFYNINLAVFVTVLMFVIPLSSGYIYCTVIPIIQPTTPFSTPFSDVLMAIFYLIKAIQGLVRHPEDRFCDRFWLSYSWTIARLERRVQELAPRFDGKILKQTLDMLRSDNDLGQFFEAIPGFCASNIIGDPRQCLDLLGQQRLAEALIGFWNRTLSSNLLSESIKGQRLIVCMGAIEAADLAITTPGTLRDLSFRYLGGISRSVEVGHSLGNFRHGNVASLARGIIAGIISNADRNDRWFTLAMDELGISKGDLRHYLAHGDSVLLANLIHIARHFFDSLSQHDSGLTRMSLSILPSASKFDILDTLPELQHDFCALWDKVVQQSLESQDDNNPFIEILVEIWHLYVTLHGADSNLPRRPTPYPFCTADHLHNLTNHTHRAVGGTTGQTTQAATTTSPVPAPMSSSGDAVEHVTILDQSSHSAPSEKHDLPIASHRAATQGTAETSPIPSMAQPSVRSPLSTGDPSRPDEGITALSHSIQAQTATITRRASTL